MDRRNFIRGMLTSVAGATAMVTLATPEETQALVVQQPVVVAQPPKIILDSMPEIDTVVYLKVRDEFKPLGYITSLNIFRDKVETSMAYEGFVRFAPGLLHGELWFKGPSL